MTLALSFKLSQAKVSIRILKKEKKSIFLLTSTKKDFALSAATVIKDENLLCI